MITADLTGLRFSSKVIVPLTPTKPSVTAKAGDVQSTSVKDVKASSSVSIRRKPIVSVALSEFYDIYLNNSTVTSSKITGDTSTSILMNSIITDSSLQNTIAINCAFENVFEEGED